MVKELKIVNWSRALAMIPMVVVYFIAQKYIVAGMTAGAVKN